MDPVSLALGVSGLALQAYGAYEKYSGAQKYQESQMKVFGLEKAGDEVRRQAMEVDARRKSMESLRNQQRSRSIALNNSTTQGAQYGSGLQGGYGQIAGYGGTTMNNINQNLLAGRSLFDLNAQISGEKYNQSQAQSQQVFGSGLSTLGGALTTSIPFMKQLTGLNSMTMGKQANNTSGETNWGSGEF